jgi:hypothetical protein
MKAVKFTLCQSSNEPNALYTANVANIKQAVAAMGP